MRIAPRVRRTLLLTTLALLATSNRAAAQTETIEYYGTDAVGSVRIVFNASGTVLGRQDYDPFGREILSAWGVPPERFGGQTTDGEVQQAYFHARQFQSRTGRFGATDPVFDAVSQPQEWARYSYARNNPLRNVDFFGLEDKQGPTTDRYGYNCGEILKKNPKDFWCAPSPDPIPLSFLNGPRISVLGTHGLSDRNDRRRWSPSIGPEPQPSASPRDGWTVQVGVSGAAVAGTGVTASTGLLLGATGCPSGGLAAGGYGSGGFAAGVDVSVSANFTVYHESVKHVRGTGGSLSASWGPISVSVPLASDGTPIGFSLGVGEGYGASAAVTGTGVAVAGRGMTWSGTCK
jgi:RHS repeat-associated protein